MYIPSRIRVKISLTFTTTQMLSLNLKKQSSTFIKVQHERNEIIAYYISIRYVTFALVPQRRDPSANIFFQLTCDHCNYFYTTIYTIAGLPRLIIRIRLSVLVPLSNFGRTEHRKVPKGAQGTAR